jgi:Mn2+/Fe2+ NRAMP family transporter
MFELFLPFKDASLKILGPGLVTGAADDDPSGIATRITGRGIAGNIYRFYPRLALYSVVALLLIANIINIGADIGAMGASLRLATIRDKA